MEALFMRVLAASVVGGGAILVVLLARLLLGKLPKVYSYSLWLPVAALLCGFVTFTSPIGLGLTQAAEYTTQLPLILTQAAKAQTEAAVPDGPVGVILPDPVSPGKTLPPINLPPAVAESLAPTPDYSIDPIQVYLFVAAAVWVFVAGLLVLYGVASAMALWWRLRGAACQPDGSYQTQTLQTPFVMGLLRPRIYLPAGLEPAQRDYVLLHERTHIRRGDHLIKPLAYLLLCLHWFNPLCWLAFYCMSRDMEMSCDEAVIRRLGSEVKQDYTRSLLSLATGRVIWNGSPLAFGEGSAAGRIKNALHYKKPALWVTILVVIALAALCLSLVTGQPQTPQEDTSLPAALYENRGEAVGRGESGLIVLRTLPLDAVYGLDAGKISRQGWAEDNRQLVELTTDDPAMLEIPPKGSRAEGIYQRAALLSFSLIKELESVTYQWTLVDSNNEPTDTYSQVYIRDWAVETLGEDPWNRSKSYADFQALYDQLTTQLVDSRIRDVFIDSSSFDTTDIFLQIHSFTLPQEFDQNDGMRVAEYTTEHFVEQYRSTMNKLGYTIATVTVTAPELVAGDANEFVFHTTADIHTGSEKLLPLLPAKEPRMVAHDQYLSAGNSWYMRVQHTGNRQYRIVDMSSGLVQDGLTAPYNDRVALAAVPPSQGTLTFTAPYDYVYLIHIGQLAVEAYMNAKFSEQLPLSERVTSYRVGDIQLVAGEKPEFCVAATLDYTTAAKETMLITANGEMRPNDQGTWDITDSRLEFRVRHLQGDEWQLVSVGTGGGGRGLIPRSPEEIPQGYDPNLELAVARLTQEEKQSIERAVQEMLARYRAGDAPAGPTFQPDAFAPLPADIDWGQTGDGDIQIGRGHEMFPFLATVDSPVNYSVLLYISFLELEENAPPEAVVSSVSFLPK